jgi:hypothetical protein
MVELDKIPQVCSAIAVAHNVEVIHSGCSSPFVISPSTVSKTVV